jgi:hypothetical protein
MSILAYVLDPTAISKHQQRRNELIKGLIYSVSRHQQAFFAHRVVGVEMADNEHFSLCFRPDSYF